MFSFYEDYYSAILINFSVQERNFLFTILIVLNCTIMHRDLSNALACRMKEQSAGATVKNLSTSTEPTQKRYVTKQKVRVLQLIGQFNCELSSYYYRPSKVKRKKPQGRAPALLKQSAECP